jgi:regulator of sigma E protease
MTTLVAFLFALSVLVFIHELGHYLVARWCGVKVLRFSIGFGKPIVSWKVGRDRTEWSLSPIPLGGYVKMLDEREDGKIDPAELHRAFTRQSLARRSAIVVAGPLANFLLAIVLYAWLAMAGIQEAAPLIGEPTAATEAARAGLREGDKVVAVDGEPVSTFNEMRLRMIDGIVDKRPVRLELQSGQGDRRTVSIETAQLPEGELERDFTRTLGIELAAGKIVVGSVVADSAAAAAGLKAGDEVVSVAGQPVRRSRALIDTIRAHPERPLALVVRRGGAEVAITVTPRGEIESSAQSAAHGSPASGTTANGPTAAGGRIGKIGAALQQQVQMTEVEYGPLAALAHGTKKTWDMSIFSLRMMGKMVTGDLSWKNLSGPVAIADFAGQSVQVGWFAYVAFLALISVSLGVLNLLPVPVLDGGHLVYYGLEAIKGRPLSERFMEVTQKVGLAMVAGLMVVALFNDLSRLFG